MVAAGDYKGKDNVPIVFKTAMKIRNYGGTVNIY